MKIWIKSENNFKKYINITFLFLIFKHFLSLKVSIIYNFKYQYLYVTTQSKNTVCQNYNLRFSYLSARDMC